MEEDLDRQLYEALKLREFTIAAVLETDDEKRAMMLDLIRKYDGASNE